MDPATVENIKQIGNLLHFINYDLPGGLPTLEEEHLDEFMRINGIDEDEQADWKIKAKKFILDTFKYDVDAKAAVIARSSYSGQDVDIDQTAMHEQAGIPDLEHLRYEKLELDRTNNTQLPAPPVIPDLSNVPQPPEDFPWMTHVQYEDYLENFGKTVIDQIADNIAETPQEDVDNELIQAIDILKKYNLTAEEINNYVS
jgi:hypothetical protein